MSTKILVFCYNLRIVRIMREIDDDDMRPRTIRWHVETDRLAKRLAAERDLEGGVSELLEKLVKREEYEPRLPLAEPTSGYKQEIQQSKKLSIKGLKGPNKKT